MESIMASLASISFRDYSHEQSGTGFYVASITSGGDFDAAVNAANAIFNAIANLSAGTLYKSSIRSVFSQSPITLPPEREAQREAKARIIYAAQDGRRGSYYVPVFNYTGVQQATDRIDVSGTGWQDFIAAFDANVRSPNGSQASFEYAKFVGRNS